MPPWTEAEVGEVTPWPWEIHWVQAHTAVGWIHVGTGDYWVQAGTAVDLCQGDIVHGWIQVGTVDIAEGRTAQGHTV